MKSIKLKNLDLSLEESRDIIEFLAQKRNINNYEHMTNEELLSTLKKKKQQPQNPPRLGKRKSNLILATQKPLKVAKLEINQNLTLQRPLKFAKGRKTQNLTPQKQQKSTKQEKSKNNQQQIKSKNKERIEVIREQLRELGYKLLRDELKEIKRCLYMVENKKGVLE